MKALKLNSTSTTRQVSISNLFSNASIKALFLFILVLFLGNATIKAEDCIRFNPDKIEIVPYTGGQYRIIENGNHAMFLFPNYAEAKQAYTVIKKYRINQSCFVGRPGPSFEYLLVNGQSPKGKIAGEDCINFNPNTIKVTCIKGDWKIVDGSHWMFSFGNKKSEAYEAYNVIKKYGFTKSCYVGRPNASLTYLRKDAAPTTTTAPKIDGLWVNEDSNTRGVTQVKVSNNGTRLQAWGSCHPTDCDWGTTKLAFNGGSSHNAVFTPSFAKKSVYITKRGSKLKVLVYTKYNDNRTDRKDVYYMIPAKPIYNKLPNLKDLVITPKFGF